MICLWVLCFVLFPYSLSYPESWMPLINLTHHILRDTNSSFFPNCWVCLSTRTQRSLAVPAPLSTWTDSPMKLHLTYSVKAFSGSYPITDIERRLQLFHPLTASYSFHNPDRRAIAFLQLVSSTGIFPIITRLTSVIYPDKDRFFESAQRPLWGPLFTETLLMSQAPLCISRSFKVPAYATFVGTLSASLCNYTLHISPSNSHVNLDLSTTHLFKQAMKRPDAKWKNPLRFSGPPSLVSSERFYYPCPTDIKHCHTSPATPWMRCPLSPSGTCYNLTLFETDNLTHPVTMSVNPTYFKLKLQGHRDPYPLSHYQPLIGAALSGQYSVWENEVTIQENWGVTSNTFSHLLTFSYSFCLNSSGVFFLCGTSTYMCLPANWSGVCTLVFQYPDIELLPNNQTVSVPLFASVRASASHPKRSPHLFPFLAGLGISSALGTGIAGLASSTFYFQRLSKALSDTLDEIAASVTTLQSQIDSLAGVVLQNRRALDLIAAEKGGTCLFLQEECCFYVNQSGIVRDAARKLRERASELGQHSDSWGQWPNPGYWLSWLTPFLGPLLFIVFLLTFGSCLLNCLTRFVSRRLGSFVQDATKRHVDSILQNVHYKRLPQDAPDEDTAPVYQGEVGRAPALSSLLSS
ncbi:syncytin b isoform X1 [Microtus ochrogaster]|uniref:Syncytin b isoform X1 n=1 Tax=Microtus ochrogaster TaxID=79684 RepID=A0ABM0GHT8_MICOH|nr:syncytin b precursor [Microtus ochrogaster]XP_013204697.1 syncytin b isoform X1 [Microtus ochrogaster]